MSDSPRYYKEIRKEKQVGDWGLTSGIHGGGKRGREGTKGKGKKKERRAEGGGVNDGVKKWMTELVKVTLCLKRCSPLSRIPWPSVAKPGAQAPPR